jgi:hypothetical protein
MNAPTSPLPPCWRERLAAAAPFLWTALLALLGAGFVAAAAIHAPTKPLMWAVAYLVLVGGVAQGVLGLGQALLPSRPPAPAWRHAEWWLFNLGNAGVIAGTLRVLPLLVALGTTAFVAALVAFLLGVRGAGAGWLLHAFRAVLVVTSLGACVGLALAVSGVAV